MKVFHIFAAALFVAAVSCERHSWEDTKVLHEQHGDHDHADHAGHGDHAEGEHAH